VNSLGRRSSDELDSEDEKVSVKAETVIAAEEKRIKKMEKNAIRLSRLIEAYLQRGEKDKAMSCYQELKSLYPLQSLFSWNQHSAPSQPAQPGVSQ